VNEHQIIFNQIEIILESPSTLKVKAQKIAELICLEGNYRWAGIYEVAEKEISIIAWSGQNSPEYPKFPITKGLSGEVIRTQTTIISNDVSNNHHYLKTFENTKSEIIVPIINNGGNIVIGTLDVESDKKNAFSQKDKIFLEECANEIATLWN
jgi:L-methionine (R)-S-oxide reductase